MLKRILGLSIGRYHALNLIEISTSSLLHNYQYLKRKSGQTLFPVLKSNAYGHGLISVARILDKQSVPFFCVDSIYEAYELMKARIKTPVLIMGYIHPDNLKVKKLPFSYAVYGLEMIEAISKYQPHAGVHIFVDTGMHREGVLLTDLNKIVKKCKQLKIKIEGLMSHLAMADKPSDKHTKEQILNFEEAERILENEGVYPQWRHIGASSFVLNREEYPSNSGNAARVGIALYGIDPENKNNIIKPALMLKSTIVQIKNVKKGDRVGYDFTYTAQGDQKIAVLPIGFNDGINRRLSNRGFVLIKDCFCPIRGRVSMNLCEVDVTSVPTVTIGDEAIIYSSDLESKNSLNNSAKLCDIIPYELLISLHSSTKRVTINSH